jgi:pantetheine-phosphate adenylyltransferase
MPISERIGIYPGTFDPITYGHVDIINRALRVVDKLIVAVALDTGKQPIFTLEERTNMVRHDMGQLGVDPARIEVQSFSGLLVKFAAAHNATLLIRGLRAVSDFEYEFQMSCMNSKLAPEIETVFLTASESTHFVSSRFIKKIACLGGDVGEFVSPHVMEQLRLHFI